MKSRHRKIIKITSIVLVAIVAIVFILTQATRYLFDYLAMQLALDCKSKEELSEILINNIDDFEEAVEILTLNEDRYWISVETASHKLFPFIEVLFGDHIFIEGNKNILTRQLKKEIRNSKIEYILNELDFVKIIANSDYIQFINRTTIGGSPLILYSRTEEEPDLWYSNAEKIMDNWYYWVD